MYFHDMGIIKDMHHNMLKNACDEVFDLISIGIDQHTTFPEDMTIVKQEPEDEMGVYSNDMD